jgi:general secretion pathway protein E
MASDLPKAGARPGQLEGRNLDTALDELLSARRLLDAAGLAELLQLPLASEAEQPDLLPHGDRLSVNFLREARVLPLADTAEGLVVAMADPLDSYAIGAMQLFAGKPVQIRVGVPADIEAALERLFGSSAGGEVVQTLGDMTELGADDDIQRLRDLASEAPVIRIVNRLGR